MKTVTFRSHILAEVNDQLTDEGLSFPSANEIVTEMVAQLSNFTEEGVTFLPEIVVTDDFPTLKKAFTDTFHVYIGNVNADNAAAKKILKACGPLTIAGWSIFIHIKRNKLDFGLFRQSWMPFSLSIDDTINAGGDFPAKFLYIRKSFGNAILVSGPKSEARRIIFSTQRDVTANEEDKLTQLASAISGQVNNRQERVGQFLYRTLKTILLKSHGCMIIVTLNVTNKPPGILKDNVNIIPPLDIAKSVQDYAGHEDQSTLSNLQSIPSLMKGMVESDGVVCFSPDARLIAYRGFTRERRKTSGQAGAVGGARRRAFEALSGEVHAPAREFKGTLACVFMLSSDGSMQLRQQNDR